MMSAAPSAELLDGLQRYARYVVIIAEQLEAVSRGEQNRLQALMEERRALEGQSGGRLGEPERGAQPEHVFEELLRIGIAQVAEKYDAMRLNRDRWTDISNGALTSARSLSLPPTSHQGRYAELSSCGERLDLTL